MRRYISKNRCVRKLHSILVFTVAFWTFVLCASASSGNTTNSQAPPVAIANVSDIPPVLDGKVIGDAAWSNVIPVTEFWQRAPDEGELSSEKTEVRITYTENTLYVGVVCYCTYPDEIVISDSRRDASLDQTDSFRFILDTYKDGQNAFVFGTNPAGIEYDAQITKEGEGAFVGGRQQAGAGGGFNLNWDGSWEVRTKVSELGWSAEFAIPFRTLRFSNNKDQEWGVNFQRTIARRKEQSFWAPIPRQFNINRVSMAGTLTGLQVASPRNLKVSPYVLGKGNGNVGPDMKSTSEFGLDVKYSVTPGLTLDVTYNTDFAQVEVDDQQINLNRFSLFFPEKRPFFLENAGLFSVGENTFFGPDIELFFSRQIGIGPDGASVPIRGGARLSGSLAGVNIGALHMLSESVADISNRNAFSVARLRKELPNRTAFGALATNRQTSGGSTASDYNRAFAVDGQLGIRKYGQFKGFVAKTVTPGLKEDQFAYSLETNHDGEKFKLQARYTEVGEDFNPEMGFLKRQGYRKWLFRIMRRYRPGDFLGFLELRPHVTYWGYWKLDGFQETGFLHIDNHWEWKNGYRIDTGYNFTSEGVLEDFEITEGVVIPQGTYDHQEVLFRANTDLTKSLGIIERVTIGGFFGGERISLRTTVKFRLGETFNSEFVSQYDDVSLPGGDFITHLFKARLTYAFSPKLYLQSLIQYNNQTDEWSFNWRFTWLQTAGTGFYFVYNHTTDIDGIPISTRNQSIIIKYSYLFDAFK